MGKGEEGQSKKGTHCKAKHIQLDYDNDLHFIPSDSGRFPNWIVDIEWHTVPRSLMRYKGHYWGNRRRRHHRYNWRSEPTHKKPTRGSWWSSKNDTLVLIVAYNNGYVDNERDRDNGDVFEWIKLVKQRWREDEDQYNETKNKRTSYDHSFNPPILYLSTTAMIHPTQDPSQSMRFQSTSGRQWWPDSWWQHQ